jgi:hypothetical protein
MNTPGVIIEANSSNDGATIAFTSDGNHRRTLQAVLLLLGVLIAAYYNIIFLGQTLVASSDYYPF